MLEKEKALVICSRILERDKKNAEYYVGDYCITLKLTPDPDTFEWTCQGRDNLPTNNGEKQM